VTTADLHSSRLWACWKLNELCSSAAKAFKSSPTMTWASAQPSCTSSCSGPNVLLTTLFTNMKHVHSCLIRVVWLPVHRQIDETRLLVWRLIQTYQAVPMPRRAAKGSDCLSHLIYTVRPFDSHMPCRARYHATTMPFRQRLLKATAQRSTGATWAWRVWISIGRPETACGWTARVRLLPATTWSSTKVVIRSIPVR
jgi:hypothetical protein